MSQNLNVRIALKRDTSANWTTANPVLLNGEIILVDTADGQLRAKVGNGVKTYTQLPFTDEALRALITDVDNNNSAVVMTKDGESRLLDTFNVIKLTQEEYDELEASDSIDPDALYLTEGRENAEGLDLNSITGSVVTGEKIITLNDTIDSTVLTKLKLYGKSTQDGTPSPSAPVDIVSNELDELWVGGKNLLEVLPDSGTKNGVTSTHNGDGTISISGERENQATAIGFTNNFYPRLPGTYSCTLKGAELLTSVSQRSFVNLYYGDKTYNSIAQFGEGQRNLPNSFVVTQDMLSYGNCRINFGFWWDGSATKTISGTFAFGIEFGDTATEYTPYQGHTYPLDLTLRGIPVDSGGNYTDKSGQQWIADTYDVATGEYVQRVKKLVLDGTEAWSSHDNADGKYRKTTNIRDCIRIKSINKVLSPVMSTRYVQSSAWQVNNQKDMARISCTASFPGLQLYDPSYDTNDVSLWKAHLAELYAAGTPVTVLYALAEPIITQLNPAYIPAYAPMTNVVANGDITVEYNHIPKSAQQVYTVLNEQVGSKVVITQDGVSEELDIFNIIRLNQEDYDQLVTENNIDPYALYLTENNKDFQFNITINGVTEEHSGLEIVKLTQEEYNAIKDSDSYDPYTLYSVTDPTPTVSYINEIVEKGLAKYVPLSGGQMTGALKLRANPVDNFEAATKKYVDDWNYEIVDNLEERLKQFLPIAGGTVTGAVKITNKTPSNDMTTGALVVAGGLGVGGDVHADKLWGAVWNDYAEFREAEQDFTPGTCVQEKGDDSLVICNEDCAAGCYIVSDTFGISIGQSKKANTPVAVSGRVLAYTAEDSEIYKNNIGQPVCGTYDGKIRLMSETEASLYPWKILGTVSSVPNYNIWENDIIVDARVWIKVR